MAELCRKRTIIVKHAGVDVLPVLKAISGLVAEDCATSIFECIQAESKGVTNITFNKEEHVDIVTEKSELKVGEVDITLHRADAKVTTVVVKNLPYEIEEKTVRSLYAEYGKIVSVTRDRIRSGEFKGVFNGSWLVRMEIQKDVPNYIAWGRYRALNLHPEMRRVCRKCNEPGHLAADCAQMNCFNCGVPGHRAKDCKVGKSFAAVVAGEERKEDTKQVEEENVVKPLTEKTQDAEGTNAVKKKREEAAEIKVKEPAPKAKVTTATKGKPGKKPKIPSETMTFLRTWLTGKLEKDYETTIKDAEKKCLLADEQDIREQAENHERVCFETTGELVFLKPKEGAGVEPGREVYNTKEMNLKAYSFLGPLKS